MSVYLKVLPAVLLDPDVLLILGQKICSIVRETLILDRRMEEICIAIEREGRTLNDVIDRITTTPFSSALDDAALGCEKVCSLLKAGIQLNLFLPDSKRVAQASLLYNVLENQDKCIQSEGYQCSDRMSDILRTLEADQMQQALLYLDLLPFYHELKDVYKRFETVLFENSLIKQPDQLPNLRSTIALYGMLVDTLIANVRFENYQLLHRVEIVLKRIETAIGEATNTMVQRQKALSKNFIVTAEPQAAVA